MEEKIADLVKESSGNIGGEESWKDWNEEAIVTSRRKLSQEGRKALIVAQWLPTWLAYISTLSFEEIDLYVEDESYWFRRSTRVKVNECNVEKLFVEKEKLTREHSVFIQGTFEFCKGILEKIVENTSCELFCVTSLEGLGRKETKTFFKTYKDALKFQFVEHHLVGGVTKAQFLVIYRSSRTINPPEEKVYIKRTLASIIDPVQNGLEVKSDTLVDPNVHVRKDDLLKYVKANSVFTKDKCCKRKLTPKEVALAMDFTLEAVRQVKTAVEMQKDLLEKLVNTVPLKILQYVLDQSFYETTCTSGFSAEKLDVWQPFFNDHGIIDAEKLSEEHKKAARNDDSEVNEEIWNEKIIRRAPRSLKDKLLKLTEKEQIEFFTACRKLQLPFYRWSLRKSFIRYLKSKYGNESLYDKAIRRDPQLKRDILIYRDILWRTIGGSFWNWDRGSRLIFWKWNESYQMQARDGTKSFIRENRLPTQKKPQRLLKDEEMRELELSKIHNFTSRRYIEDGYVISIANWFAVPKGESDVRVVFNFKSSGLNDALFAPNFFLPTNEDLTNLLTDSSWMVDSDCGEQFYCFTEDQGILPYVGVDLTAIGRLKDPSSKTDYKRWGRLGQGVKHSPFKAQRGMLFAKEITRGNRLDQTNPFHWTKVMTNYPGTANYNPVMPRVYKFNPITKTIAGDVIGFVDDVRSAGANRNQAEDVQHKHVTTTQALGIQDAPRKRRPAFNTDGGAWTGTVTAAVPGLGVFEKTMDCKWAKLRDILFKYKGLITTTDRLNRKEMESDVGFMAHVMLTYTLGKPYLKVFYLTLNAWRPYREENGWKLFGRSKRIFLEHCGVNGDYIEDEPDAPDEVTAVPDFELYLNALLYLFQSEIPQYKLVRGASIGLVGYGFGDASGSGFGASWQTTTEVPVFRIGMWNKAGLDSSSNFKEFENSVKTLEEMGERNELRGYELFYFTDNSVSEAAAFRGSSKSKKLFELILRLWTLEMKYGCKIHFIHIAGTRMIEQGTDGISRGNLNEGICKGERMLKFVVPLAETALQRASNLETWIRGWSAGEDLELLEPEGWFERGHCISGGKLNSDNIWMPEHKDGVFLWNPAPAGASFAAKQLREARHKRPDISHIFICPRIMCQEWIKHLFKSADLVLVIPAGQDYWSKEMHEPLVLGLYLPYVKCEPWEWKKSQLMLDLAGKLRGVWKEGKGTEGDILSQLWSASRNTSEMSFCELRKLLQGDGNYRFPSL